LSDPVLDPEILGSLLALDEDGQFVTGLFVTYFEEAAEALRDLRIAFDAVDVAKARRAAHYLLGASMNIGATSVADLCRNLEEISETANALPDGGVLQAIADEISRVQAASREIR
jgi:hypothetical protein